MPASHDRLRAIFKGWTDWRVTSGLADSDGCSEHELLRRARYLGIPAAQLRWVSSDAPDPVGLLERRMEALSLDPTEVAGMESPCSVRELQQRCARCTMRGRCALDLADKFADPGWLYWRSYCPNAATLSMLSTRC